MRTAIYVPDALWNVASALYPSDGASALTQRGLKALLRENDGPELAAIVAELDDERRSAFVESILKEG